MPVSSLIENAFKVFGLDLNGLMCDNILAYLPCVYSIFTTLELSPDPLYDKDANKPWWELAWNAIVNWLAGVAKWFSEIDIGIKIGVGLLVFAAACALVIMSAPTGGTTLAGAIAAYTGMSNTIAAATVAGMAITYAVGIASAAAMGAVSALLSGGDIVEAMTNAVADAIFWGGVFAFISAGINALKTVARTTYNAKLPGSSQTGAQPQSTVNYPPNNGAVLGSEEVINLAPGKYGRYGKIMERSNYITDAGMSASQLSLPPWNNGVYTEITVVKTIPNVVKSTVAPWAEWNGIGGGIQYMLPMSIMELKNLGYLVF